MHPEKTQMLRAMLLLFPAYLLISSITTAEDKSVEKLWTRWRAGQDGAYDQLLELGPETRALAGRTLNPEGETFPAWPEWEEASLLESMRADAVPEIIKAIKQSLPGDDRARFINHLASLGRMARPAGDVL